MPIFIVRSDFLLQFSSVTNAVEENQNRFLEHKGGILRHIKNLSHTDSHSFTEYFVKPIYANMLFERDLYYGSGDSTLSSHGNFSAQKLGEKIFVTGEVDVSWCDRYNWGHGRTTNVVGMREFDDRHFAYLEEKGFVKLCNMVSSWKYSFSGTYDENSKKWEGVKWQRKKIVLIFLTVLLALVIFGLSLLNFLWVELPKVTRRPDGEGFIHQKIDDEEILCYLVEGMHLGYDLRINDNKIYIKYKDTITLDKLDWLANLSSRAEELKLENKQNKLGYYCTDLDNFY